MLELPGTQRLQAEAAVAAQEPKAGRAQPAVAAAAVAEWSQYLLSTLWPERALLFLPTAAMALTVPALTPVVAAVAAVAS